MSSFLKKKLKKVVHKVIATVTRFLDPVEWYLAAFNKPSHRDIYCATTAIALLIVAPGADIVVASVFAAGGFVCATIKIPGVE
jgi:hypothetical protein